MKKLKLILMCALLVGTSAFAQQKFGYTNVDQIIMFLPEIKDVQTKLQAFKKDSIDALLPYLVGEYQKKDSIFKIEKNDVVKQRIGKELDDLQQQLNNWQSYTQQRIQAKQQELLAPLYQKVGVALKQVADEKKLAYVFNYNGLLYAPPADDISLDLLKQLGVDTTELEKQALAEQNKATEKVNPKEASATTPGKKKK